MEMPYDDLQFKLRIPRELAEIVKELADYNKRSINAEVIFSLEQHVKNNLLIEGEDSTDSNNPDDGFKSLSAEYGYGRGKRPQSFDVVIRQHKIANSKSPYLNIKISRNVIACSGIRPGNRADVLYDSKRNLWKVKLVKSGGFKVTGYTGVRGICSAADIRLAARESMPLLSDNINANIKAMSDDSLSEIGDGYIIFKLKESE